MLRIESAIEELLWELPFGRLYTSKHNDGRFHHSGFYFGVLFVVTFGLNPEHSHYAYAFRVWAPGCFAVTGGGRIEVTQGPEIEYRVREAVREYHSKRHNYVLAS